MNITEERLTELEIDIYDLKLEQERTRKAIRATLVTLAQSPQTAIQAAQEDL